MCDAKGVSVGEERIEAATIIWAAGVMASPAGIWLGAETDSAGRVKVRPDLSIPGLPDIFVAGDTAYCADGKGKALPGVAPVAKQQGQYIARLLIERAQGRDLPAFRYSDIGMMATIGRKRAVVQVGSLRLTGFVAWLVWCVAHIYFLIGFRNRLSVAMNWLWSYLAFQRGTRLITGLSGSRMEDMAEPPPMEPRKEQEEHAHRSGQEHSNSQPTVATTQMPKLLTAPPSA
jgi:NADH:ubiquinone reductase (H+-translocating)